MTSSPPPQNESGIFLPYRFGPSPRSTLFIPERRSRPRDGLNPGDLTRTYVGWKEVIGKEATWEDAAERLRDYSLHQILKVVGGMSGAIHATDLSASWNLQMRLCQWLFTDATGSVLRAALELTETIRERGTAIPNPVTPFHQLQLINAAKLALLEVPPDNPSQTDSLRRLGEALLAINDLLQKEETLGDLPSDVEDAEDRRKWVQFLLANGRFFSFDNPMYEMARSRELYLTDRSHLRESAGAYLDLPTTAERLVGLPLDQLLIRNAGVYFWWGQRYDPDNPELPQPVDIDTFFTENFDFDPAEEEAFWQFMGAEPGQLRREFRQAGCGDGSLRPYHVLPFEKHPIVIHDGRAYATSALHLARKVTSGLHHVFLSGLETDQARERYLTYFGAVFEDYVQDIFSRMFGDHPGRLIHEATLQGRAPEGESVCDGLIIYPGCAIVYEIKSPRLKLQARTEGDWAAMEEFIERVFLSASRQIHSTIQLIEDGILEDEGLDHRYFDNYLPVVVTQEQVLMQPYLYSLIESQISDYDLLTCPKIRPLQQLDVGDLEQLESAVNRGYELRTVLDDRIKHGGNLMDFVNYAWQHDQSLIEGPNEHLQERFRRTNQSLLEYLRSRRKNNSQPDPAT